MKLCNLLVAVFTAVYLSSAAVARPLEVNYEPQRTDVLGDGSGDSSTGSVRCTVSSIPSVCKLGSWEAFKEEVPYWKIWGSNLPQDSQRNAIIQMLQEGSASISPVETSAVSTENLKQEMNKKLGRHVLGLGMMLSGLIMLILSIEWWINRSEQYKFWKQHRRSI